jgi:pyridoxal phosphate enzyme (YggS family)
MGIADALSEVEEKIQKAAIHAGRNFDTIKLVVVSKTIGLPKIIEATEAGVTILGENRVQEAKNKILELKNRDIELNVEWHLIGNLQKNKAGTAVLLFDLIHSVDSEKLARELDKKAATVDKKQRILVQVKLSDEESKHGLPENELLELLDKITSMENLSLEGLMTMPPFFEEPEKTRPYFIRLRELAERAAKRGLPVSELSMGMSGDFEIAIEEGATLVRIGTAIFGERPQNIS